MQAVCGQRQKATTCEWRSQTSSDVTYHLNCLHSRTLGNKFGLFLSHWSMGFRYTKTPITTTLPIINQSFVFSDSAVLIKTYFSFSGPGNKSFQLTKSVIKIISQNRQVTHTAFIYLLELQRLKTLILASVYRADCSWGPFRKPALLIGSWMATIFVMFPGSFCVCTSMS